MYVNYPLSCVYMDILCSTSDKNKSLQNTLQNNYLHTSTHLLIWMKI